MAEVRWTVGGRCLIALLNQLVTAARKGGQGGPSRSVMGTIELDPDDPEFEQADAAVRALFDASIPRSFSVRETGPAARARLKKRKRRG